MIRFIFLTGCVLLLAGRTYAQFYPDPASGDTANYPYWIQMMQDPNAKYNATVSAFDKYWQNRTDYKGNGWKPFKRWEYINRDRVQPDGRLQAPDQVMREYLRYEDAHPQKSTSGNWSCVGPIALPDNDTWQPNGMGRINAVAFHPTDPNTIFIGAPSGGFWKTTDGGTTWSNLTGNLPTLGVSAVLVHPVTPTTILLGTGDRDHGDAPGMGVYITTDGGNTWSPSNTGMGNQTVGMMAMHPSSNNIILAATSGGIYKSTDGGATWTKKSSNSNNYKDIRFKPGDPTIVYATAAGKFYRSSNTGDSWTEITSGILMGNRMVIGVSPNQPGYVYLTQTNGPFVGLLRSTDSGLNFTTQSTTPNIMDYSCNGSGNSSQAWYDLCMAVDPANANIVYVGGINIFKSLNGGVTWTIAAHWVGSTWGTGCAPSVHADIHSLDWSPLNGKLYTGCDGGIYWTANGGTSWTDISSGIAIAQVYKIGQSATVQGLDMNGYQDNGTASNEGANFTTIYGGDGMECAIDYTDPNYRYGELYYGSIFRTTTGSGYSTIKNNISESGGWVTPFILHKTVPSTMFAGFVNLWRTTNVKATSSASISWTLISSGWTGNCIALEQSPADVNVLYVSTSDATGRIRRTDNANDPSPAWVVCAPTAGTFASDMEAHPTDASTVYAVAGTHVFKSTNKAASWTEITGTLPAVTINCIAYDKNSNEGLYVGTQTGVYYKDASMTDWVAFNSGLAIVDVRELEIYYDPLDPGNNRLKAATFGRGLWESDLMGALDVQPPNQDVPYSAGSTSFTVTAIGNWNTTCSDSWCTVTPNGTGNGTITANFTENTATTPRVATITVHGLNVSPVLVTVTQAPYPTLDVEPPNQDVPAPAGNTSFSVASNSSWTVTSNSTWCTVTPSGSGNGTIVADYTENLDINPRMATLTVTVTGLAPVTVTVSQAGANPTLIVQPSNQDVPCPAGSTSFSVTSNTSWTASSDSPWCTVTPSGTGNGSIIADYTENTDVSQRIATITITVSGLTPQLVTVTQAGTAPTLNVSPSNQDVSAEAGTTAFSVISNTDWTVTSDSPWCTPTPSGTGNGTIDADYTENMDHNGRVATLTISVSGLSPQEVTVTQDASTVLAGSLSMDDLHIYPNPNDGSFMLKPGPLKDETLDIAILNMTGQVIHKRVCSGAEQYRFDLNNIPQGCYFIKVKYEASVIVLRLVIGR